MSAQTWFLLVDGTLVLCGIAGAVIARAKGRHVPAAFFGCLVTGQVGVIVVACLDGRTRVIEDPYTLQRRPVHLGAFDWLTGRGQQSSPLAVVLAVLAFWLPGFAGWLLSVR